MQVMHRPPLPEPRHVTIEEDDGYARFVEVSADFGEIVMLDITTEEGRRDLRHERRMTPAQAEKLGETLIEMARRATQ